MANRLELYHHPEADVYECLGCGQLVETPRLAVLKNGQRSVLIKNNQENRLVWLELMEMDHAACGLFKDARMAEEARRFRTPQVQRGSHRHTAPLASRA